MQVWFVFVHEFQKIWARLGRLGGEKQRPGLCHLEVRDRDGAQTYQLHQEWYSMPSRGHGHDLEVLFDGKPSCSEFRVASL